MTHERHQGIYLITNSKNNKVFIGSSRNLDTFKQNIIKQLEAGNYKNKGLQKDWKEQGEDNFEFTVLESCTEQLNERRNYWINQFRSNEFEYGYNQELIKRPWEQERDAWLKNKTWGVDGSIQEFLTSIVKELDYTIEFAEDRKKHLDKVITDDKLNWLIDYISSPLYCDKQIKTKNDFLTENDISTIKLSNIVDYLAFPKCINKNEKTKQLNNEYLIRKKQSDINMDYRRNNEILFGDKSEIEQINYKVQEKHVVNEEDLKRYPEIQEVYKVIQYLKTILGYGKNKEMKEELEAKIKNRYGEKQLNYLKKLYRDLSAEILAMKEILSGTIRFKRITKGSTVFNYDVDTGYFNEQDEYIVVSENKIDFSNEKQILELLNYYHDLKQRVYEDPDNDLWSILFDLDELIDRTPFKDYVKDILIMKIDGYEAKEIIDEIERVYGVVLTEKRISEIHNNIIPKMIVDTYLQDREDWIYTYKVKGTYKTCVKCETVKLLNEKYFYREPKGKDGYKNKCKLCT